MILDADTLTTALTPTQPARPRPAVRAIWATVTQASPLRVQLDLDDDPQPYTPITLTAGLAVDDQVLCLLIGGQLVILGTPQT